MIVCLLISNLSLVSQELQKPKLKEASSVCSNSARRDFQIVFRYTLFPFNNDNVFYVELSDENGNFSNFSQVATVFNRNAEVNLDIEASFQVPEGTFGTGYKIRIRASSPAVIGPESDAFEAYDMVDDGNLVLNNFNNVFICGDKNTAELKLNITSSGNFEWFKNNQPFTSTTEPRLIVSEPGLYEARINYGSCGFVRSTLSNVYVIDNVSAQIEGASEIEICSEESHTFQAVENNSEYIYSWYKDGELLTSSSSSSYTTPNSGQFGVYFLEISAGECVVKSQQIVLKQKANASFVINKNFDEKVIILPNEQKILQITVEPVLANVAIQWFRDNLPITANSTNDIIVSQAGSYFARVVEVGGICNFTQDSEPFELVALDNFATTISPSSNYATCKSESTQLQTVELHAVGTDGELYELTDDQVDTYLNFSWLKDEVQVPDALTQEFALSSYLSNGMYALAVQSGAVTSTSNTLDIKLSIISPSILSSSNSNSLCPETGIRYTVSEITPGFSYVWFKDDEALEVLDPQILEVFEIGEYKLQISGFGCLIELEPIEVIPFDESALVLSPSEKVVLQQGEPTIIEASGAASYKWYNDATGNLLSTSETLKVSKTGFYTLVARVDSCELSKTIEVVEQDDKIIVPNIVSPKTLDGINDTWQISNRYAFQPLVTVFIYNSDGIEVFSTKEYKNDWPTQDLGNQRVFYYKIIKDDRLVKAGSISVLD
ncbi:MAG: gliding motility-associated C-terminal domain-containing protein [Tenacibaculum sp.]